MKGIIYCIMAVCVLLSCHDIPEGYLFIEDAGYLPDSMVVKMNLDTASVEAPNPIWINIMMESGMIGRTSITRKKSGVSFCILKIFMKQYW